MNAKTAAALAEIKRCVAEGYRLISPPLFSHCYGMGATSAAFRIAKRQGLIEVNYIGGINSPVYQPHGTHAAIAAAISESATAIKH